MYQINRVNRNLFSVYFSDSNTTCVKYNYSGGNVVSNHDYRYYRKWRFYRICFNNDFKYFLTIGNKGLSDEVYIKKIGLFACRHLNGGLGYIVVFERFLSGFLHCHILCHEINDLSWHDVKHKNGFSRLEMYSYLVDLKFGYNSVKEIPSFEDYDRAVAYLSKYCSKEFVFPNLYSKKLRHNFNYLFKSVSSELYQLNEKTFVFVKEGVK